MIAKAGPDLDALDRFVQAVRDIIRQFVEALSFYPDLDQRIGRYERKKARAMERSYRNSRGLDRRRYRH